MKSASVRLEWESEVTPSRFAEVGRPSAAFRDPDERFVALASVLDGIGAPGTTPPVTSYAHRLSLYDAAVGRRLGVFDGARYPINDVGFHPTRPMVAIATGTFDGGWAFEGELWLWDWERDDACDVLSERREVTRVRWDGDEALTLLLRPRNEEELDGCDALSTFVGGRLSDLRAFTALGLARHAHDPRIAAFAPVEPRSLGFEVGAYDRQHRATEWERTMGRSGFELRHHVWDLAWRDDRLLAVHEGCELEQWSLDGAHRVLRGRGRGVQLLASSRSAWLHLRERSPHPVVGPHSAEVSSLWRIERDELVPGPRFDQPIFASIDRSGRMLCREHQRFALTRERPPRRDVVLTASSEVESTADLGALDVFNHCLRIDGADGLFYLRGEEPRPFEKKKLCMIDASGEARELFAWDADDEHRMLAVACVAADGTMVRAYRVYAPNPSEAKHFVEALEMPSGRSRWKVALGAAPMVVAALRDQPFAILALRDARLVVIDTRTGDLVDEQRIDQGGVTSTPLSLAATGERVACGTLDGRVLIYRLRSRS